MGYGNDPGENINTYLESLEERRRQNTAANAGAMATAALWGTAAYVAREGYRAHRDRKDQAATGDQTQQTGGIPWGWLVVVLAVIWILWAIF